MEIDKLNGNVAFKNSNHTYFDINDESKQYISVTTLIHKFTQPFDSEFWSAYKALEKLLPKETWNIEKKSLLNLKRFDKELLNVHSIDENLFNKTQQDILDEWQRKNIESCERGSKIHLELENSFYNAGKNVSLNKFGIGGKFECKKNYSELDLEYGVYPEYLISRTSDDGILRIAGQIDLVVKDGNDIYLIDHKTNEKIDQKSGFDTKTKGNAKMLYPLNNLMDSNYWHYALQLSTYAWMLQKINPNFVIKDLIINHYDHNNNNVLYHCDYLKTEVERMLWYYKQSVIKEAQQEKLKESNTKMNIGNIISGHVNEFFGLNKDIMKERLKICKKCPLYSKKFGTEICNSSLYIDPKTGELSLEYKDGYKRGCGCRIKAKLTILDEKCPIDKW